VKTPFPQILELLALAELDFVVLDAEHSSFALDSLSPSLGIAGLARLPTLVRTPNHDAAFINSCLDMGADGILIPHVRSAADVDAIADAVTYSRGRRGFSPSTRAGRYGMLGPDCRSIADQRNGIWCQIEDREALEAIDEIAANDAVDCLFIGPADLSFSLGLSGPDDPRLEAAVQPILSAAERHSRAVGMFVSRPEQIASAVSKSISVIICASDQALLLGGARQVSRTMAESLVGGP
jgi:2-keto-3-deoxy-L-rhamnonate aldolase RhmA